MITNEFESDETIETFWVKIYMAGPIDAIKQTCREFCGKAGLCVTVEPTTFIYTGGEEEGAAIGLINYPRFPTSPDHVADEAMELADHLLVNTYQRSVLIQTPDTTTWKSLKVEAAVK